MTGLQGRADPVAGRSHGRQRSRRWRAHDDQATRVQEGAVHNVKRVVVPREPVDQIPLPDRGLHRDQDGLAPQGSVNPVQPIRVGAVRVVLALVLGLPGCTGEEEIPEPAAAESCDGLVDVGAQLVRAYARLFEQVRVEDLADGTETPCSTSWSVWGTSRPTLRWSGWAATRPTSTPGSPPRSGTSPPSLRRPRSCSR